MEIASHLDRYDWCRLVNVNSHFRSVVRKYAGPWAYEHGTIGALGSLRFPLAAKPYQFWRRLPIADEEDISTPDANKAAVAAQVKRIDIRPHRTADCAAFEAGELGYITREPPPRYRFNLKVLNMQFYFPWQINEHNDPRYRLHTDMLPEDENEEQCLYLSSLLDGHNLKKIVFKDIPRRIPFARALLRAGGSAHICSLQPELSASHNRGEGMSV